MVAEAEAAEGVWPRVPLWAQPPSIAEWSTDLHYRFPAPSQGERMGGPEGLPPLAGHPLQSQDRSWGLAALGAPHQTPSPFSPLLQSS